MNRKERKVRKRRNRIISRQGAKYAKFGIERIKNFTNHPGHFSELCGHGVFAGDTPRLTGARSAPYENLRVLRALVVNPTFLI